MDLNISTDQKFAMVTLKLSNIMFYSKHLLI